MLSDAFFSDDRVYRYWLIRIWDHSLPVNCCCGVNPSTADEKANDPTVRKDIGFSERQGFGGLLKLNLSAFRSTDPKPARVHFVGEGNSPSHLRAYYDLFDCQQFIACWGRNGNYLRDQALAVTTEFHAESMCFGFNPDGTPKHTLMLPYTTKMERYGPLVLAFSGVKR